MSENAPVYGCDGCSSTGGRASCSIHRPNGTVWLGDSFAEVRRLQAEIERLQGLLAEQDREFNAENLRAERAEARVKELEEELDLYTQRARELAEHDAQLINDRCKERDEARIRLTLIHALDGMSPEGLAEIAAIVAARAAAEEEHAPAAGDGDGRDGSIPGPFEG